MDSKDKKKKGLKIVHLAAECYPAAKVGGLADVVGTLPKYQAKMGMDVHVIMPKYGTPWFQKQSFTEQHYDNYWNPRETIHYSIQKLNDDSFGFHLYVIDIPGKFNRNGIYSDEQGYFQDEAERWISFQRTALDWISRWAEKPKVVHCHDHHTALTPFMMKYCYQYQEISHIPTIFTIHNERYQGAFRWTKSDLLPAFDTWKSGFLDWDNVINPFASAVKCSDRVTTVSPSYMDELKYNSLGLEGLFHQESYKLKGILNGIDTKVWDPKKDPSLKHPLKRSNFIFKKQNKEWLCKQSGLNPELPLAGFIGRLVHQKGGDLLIDTIQILLHEGEQVNFCILGTGDKQLEGLFYNLSQAFPDRVAVSLNYDENLAHQIYAGSDFLLMPSRTEPCGLNQMYAMRYGSIPIVHNIGGLKDSVEDYRSGNGTGIKFEDLNPYMIAQAIQTGMYIYSNEELRKDLIKRTMDQDFSWEKSAKIYLNVYEELI